MALSLTLLPSRHVRKEPCQTRSLYQTAPSRRSESFPILGYAGRKDFLKKVLDAFWNNGEMQLQFIVKPLIKGKIHSKMNYWKVNFHSSDKNTRPIQLTSLGIISVIGIIHSRRHSRFFSDSHKRVKEALQKPPLPSRMEQNCSVRLFLTTPECAVFFANAIVKY